MLAAGVVSLFVLEGDGGRPQASPTETPTITSEPSPTETEPTPSPTDTGTLEPSPTASPQDTDTPEPSPSPTVSPDDLEDDETISDMPVTGIATTIAGGWLLASSGALRRWVRKGW